MRGGGAPVLPMWPPPLNAGGFGYVSQGINNTGSTVNPANGLATYTPLAVTNPAGATIHKINVATVTTAGSAGAVCRLGIYKDDGTGNPGKLVLDAGTVDVTTTTGTKSITLGSDITLQPGLYWLCAAPQGGATTQATYKSFNTAGQITPTDVSGGSVQYGLRATGITGALADSPTIAGGTAAPYLASVTTT